MPSNPVDGDAQSMHFGRVIRHINPVRLFLHLSWLPVIPSPWFQHRYTHSPPLLQGISYRPWSWLWLWHDGEEYDEYIRSGTISARLGKVLILYHYLFKSAVIRLLNPSLVCSFHWPILLLICIVRYCYLRPNTIFHHEFIQRQLCLCHDNQPFLSHFLRFIKDLDVPIIEKVSWDICFRIAALSNSSQQECYTLLVDDLYVTRAKCLKYGLSKGLVLGWLGNEALPQYVPCILFEFPTDVLMVWDSSQQTLCTRAYYQSPQTPAYSINSFLHEFPIWTCGKVSQRVMGKKPFGQPKS